MKRLVLVGGGHGHIEVLRELAEHPDEGREVTLVTPGPSLLYTGMIPGFIAGHYEIDDCTVDLMALAGRAQATVERSSATLVSTTAREVICSNGSVFPYDVLSLDVGSQPFIGTTRGVEKHGILLRPLEKVIKGWSDVLVRARDGKIGAVTIVGGGAAGAELALAMEYRLRQELGLASAHVRIISNASQLVPEFAPRARRLLARKFARRNIGMHLGQTVTEVGADYVRLEHGLEFASDAVFWATGPAAHDWIRDSGLATDERGFLRTNEFLQSASHPEVFGVGDCATPQAGALPKAGVFAVRAAPLLAANLRAALEGQPLQPFVTSPRYLALVSTGNRHAVAAWNGYSWEGGWVWRWKDRIDRRFIARYRPPVRPG
jgi:pyridine nucleotide-disulfide oxidoreductase family protein